MLELIKQDMLTMIPHFCPTAAAPGSALQLQNPAGRKNGRWWYGMECQAIAVRQYLINFM